MYTARKIKTLRENMKLSQEQFANAVGRSRSTVAAWETGRKEPGRDALKVISKVFSVSIEYLIDKEEKSIIVKANDLKEVTLLEFYRNVDEDTQKSIFQLLSNAAGIKKSHTK